MKSLNDLRWFNPGRLAKYPHIFGIDSKCVDSFWDIFKDLFKRVAYDIPVGEGYPSPDDISPQLRFNWQYSSSLKIDMLCDTGLSYYLCEVKASGEIGAIGQLISYKTLLLKTYEINCPVFLKLICYSLHPDLETVAKVQGIDIIKVTI
jgi:hypothetical protein